MPLHHDLLDQAAHLAARETRKPKQASLRRAVSAAYYAVFHLLIADGARRLAPSRPDGLRALVQRAFNHGDMRTVCVAFMAGQRAFLRSGTLGQSPSRTQQLLTWPLPPELFSVMLAFEALQDARNKADYDLSRPWTRDGALNMVQVARSAFADWAVVRDTPNAAVFLTALLLNRQWGR